MMAHDRYVPYERYDAYEDYEAEEDDQEEENTEPSKELVDFLKLRQKLKEKIRQKYKKENAVALGTSPSSVKKDKTPSNAQFGSFFGPSQRVIATRVIEESKAIRETDRHVARRQPSSAPTARQSSSNSEGKHIPRERPRPVINEVQKKVQTLKETRDYSFLLSDDSDLPAPSTAPPKAAASSALPRRGSGQQQQHHHQRVERQAKKSEPPPRAAPGNRQAQPGVEPKIAPPKVIGKAVAATRPAAPAMKRPISSSSQAPSKNPLSRERPLAPSTSATASSHRALHKTSTTCLATTLDNQFSWGQYGIDGLLVQRMPSRPVERDRDESRRREKLPAPNPKKSIRPRNPFDDDDDDIDDPMSFLRNKLLSRYQSSKYRDDDGDDSDMEANFDDIMKEEKRSSKIARKEDEEQLRLIEEEEERERMRRDAKRRKIMRR
ncbi:uncharacterized protein LOC144701875 [Wolffia australiana]